MKTLCRIFAVNVLRGLRTSDLINHDKELTGSTYVLPDDVWSPPGAQEGQPEFDEALEAFSDLASWRQRRMEFATTAAKVVHEVALL